MGEKGLTGIIYEAQPPRIDLQESPVESSIEIRTAADARPGNYTVMVRASAPEGDGLAVSRLYPVRLALDVPEPAAQRQQPEPRQDSGDVSKYLAIAAVIGLAGFMAYRRFRQKSKPG
jgi:hypothetical protein